MSRKGHRIAKISGFCHVEGMREKTHFGSRARKKLGGLLADSRPGKNPTCPTRTKGRTLDTAPAPGNEETTNPMQNALSTAVSTFTLARLDGKLERSTLHRLLATGRLRMYGRTPWQQLFRHSHLPDSNESSNARHCTGSWQRGDDNWKADRVASSRGPVTDLVSVTESLK